MADLIPATRAGFSARSANFQQGGFGFSWSRDKTIIGTRQKTVPPVLSALDIWLDADDENTIATSGSEITSWTDKSENGFVFTQATPSKRPTLSLNAYYNRNHIKFDSASSQILTSASSVPASSEGEVFVACTFDAMPAVGVGYSFLCVSPDDDFDQITWGFRNFTGTIGFGISNDPAGAGADGSFVGSTGAITTGDSSVHIYNCRSVSGSSWALRADDLDLSLTTVTGTNTGNWFSDVTRTQIALGGFTGTSEGAYHDGGLLEILSYNRELTATERGAARDYLAIKWGF